VNSKLVWGLSILAPCKIKIFRHGNKAITLTDHFARGSGESRLSWIRQLRFSEAEGGMRVLLEYDPVVFAVLIFGLVALELLAFSM
jgi:hypothetical protein